MKTLIDALRVSMVEEPSAPQRGESAHPDRASVVWTPVEAREQSSAMRVGQFVNDRVTTAELPRHQLGRRFGVDRSGDTVNPARTAQVPAPTKDVLEGLAASRLPPKMYSA